MDDWEDEHVPFEMEKLADSSSTMWVFTFVLIFDGLLI